VKNKFVAIKVSISILLLYSMIGFAQESFEIYVNSRGTHSVKKYDETGNYLEDFIPAGSGGLSNPEDILFHPDGSVLITGFSNQFIKRFDGITGNYLGNFSTGYNLAGPSKMSIGPDSLIYVTQWGESQNKVVRFGLDGEFIDEFTSIGAPKGLGHAWDEDKNFYIALFGTGGSGTIHKFDSLGNDLGTFINSSVLQGPTSIWRNVIGEWLIEDWLTGKVLRYSSTGEYIGDFVSGMTNPEGIVILPDGRMLIGDWGEDAVHLVNWDGSLMGYFCSGNGLVDPNSIKLRTVFNTGLPENIHVNMEIGQLKGNRFHIQLSGLSNKFNQITVINSAGVIIEKLEMSAQVIWDAHDYPDGVYIIVYENSTRRISKKIVVNKQM
jgi:DNA-binding beta-propeller fold protein YncE